jgi:hypothetical protein
LRAWKIIVVGAALGAVSIITMGAVSIVSHVHPGSGAPAVARVSADLNGPPASTTAIAPADAAADRTYGWGPFRVVDW